MSLTIHCKNKYFDSTAQRAEDRRQKVHFCPSPFAVNFMLNLSNNRHLARKYARIFVRGHYLLRELRGTDNVQGQISKHIFTPNGGYCLYYPSNLWRNTSLVILKLDLELIATESPFARNNYLSDPNQHIKSLPKSTRRKIVNLPEHFQLICIISKGLLVCGFWNVKKAQVKINVMN